MVMKLKDFSVVKEKSITLQKNAFDCGVLVCLVSYIIPIVHI